MLVRTGQLIEQGRFPAVLVSHQCISQRRAIRQRVLRCFYVIFTAFSQSRVLRIADTFWSFMFSGPAFDRLNFDLICISKTQGQFISMDLQFHRISHRSQLYHGHFCSRYHAHIQKMLAQCSVTANGPDHCTLSNVQFF